MKTLLWLDDYRNPFENDWLPLWAPVKDYAEVVWVKSYDEFAEWITNNGLPYCICFDHDLADQHYTPPEYWDDHVATKAYQDVKNYTEKTGMDCAKWLVDYCIDNLQALPTWRVHSANPVGADNIRNYLQNFEKQSDIGILHYLDKGQTTKYDPNLGSDYNSSNKNSTK